MFIETWCKLFCPRCDSPNWFCLGDISDLTSIGDEFSAFRCWKCKNCFWIDNESQVSEDELDECVIEDGQKKAD